MRKIIIVDDDAISNYVTDKIIRKFDNTLETVCFTNSKEALEYLLANTDDHHKILLDINMPCLDGFEFIEQLLINNQRAIVNKIIAFSSSNDTDDVQRMSDLGVNNFFVKPISDNNLEILLCEVESHV